MKDQEKDIDLITRFFDLALSDEELVDFEKRIANNTEFRKKVQTFQKASTLVNNAYQTSTEQSRTQKWQKLLDTEETVKSSKNIPWKWVSGIAAGFILLVSVWQLNPTFQEPDMNQLIVNSWDKKVGLDFNTTRNTTKDSLKQDILMAFKAYENEDYQSTITLLSDYKISTIYYEDVLLLRGLSYYKKGNVDTALKTLDTLSLYPTGKKHKVARWYLGLIYIEQGNKEKAKHFLELPDHANQEIKLRE